MDIYPEVIPSRWRIFARSYFLQFSCNASLKRPSHFECLAVQSSIVRKGPTGRDTRIDAARFIGFCAVTLLHFTVVDPSAAFGAMNVVNAATRFAVPLFFVITGYLLAGSNRTPEEVIARYAKRLIPIFVFWEGLYYFIDFFILRLRSVGSFTDDPIGELLNALLHGGLAFHLWFLPWLLMTVAIFVVLKARLGIGRLLPVAVLSYLIGLAIGPYSNETGVYPYLSYMTANPESYGARDTPFFGFFFVWFGYFVASGGLSSRLSLPVLSCVALVGFLSQLAEVGIIARHAAAAGYPVPDKYDFLFGTALFGAAVFLLIIRYLPQAIADRLAPLGRYALGMYCLHGFFAIILPHRIQITAWLFNLGLAGHVILAAGVIVLTAGLTLMMARISFLRRFIS